MKTRWMREESQEPSDKEIRDEILRLLMMMPHGDSILLSDVARELRPAWRQWLPLIQEVAAEMVRDGQIEAHLNGGVVDPERSKGPIKVRLVVKKT